MVFVTSEYLHMCVYILRVIVDRWKHLCKNRGDCDNRYFTGDERRIE